MQNNPRTGLEMIFEDCIRTTIHATPSKELADSLYLAIMDIGAYRNDDKQHCHIDPIKIIEFKKEDYPDPKKIPLPLIKQHQAHILLEKMGLIKKEGNHYTLTQKGEALDYSLEKGQVYDKRKLFFLEG